MWKSKKKLDEVYKMSHISFPESCKTYRKSPNFDHIFHFALVSLKIMWGSSTFFKCSKDGREYIFTIYIIKQYDNWLEIQIFS